MNRRYVLDANSFIEAKNRYYGFDICPGFWTTLVSQNEAGRVCSIDRIERELIEWNDEIKSWIKDRAPESFFKKTEDIEVIEMYGKMVGWVNSEMQFTPAAKSEFLSVADGWVTAYAKVNDLVVVTHEAFAPEAKNRVKMPNVCEEFGIEYVNTFEMLRELDEKFIRSTKRRRRK
ncbi:MAG: DUF4411 family protein [Planctomycetaceae bacterium]|nr:DUF4411 family protein [Planctomycetaceae bacterium]